MTSIPLDVPRCVLCADVATRFDVAGSPLCELHVDFVRQVARDALSNDPARVERAGQAIILGRYPS